MNHIIPRGKRPLSVSKESLAALFIHRLLKKGKKCLAYRTFYEALTLTHKRTNLNPLIVLTQAIKNASPTVSVKAKRKGGATYQIPTPLTKEQSSRLAIGWILDAAKKRNGPNMIWRLSSELIDAARKTGSTIRRREETHRMAEANRVFSHYR